MSGTRTGPNSVATAAAVALAASAAMLAPDRSAHPQDAAAPPAASAPDPVHGAALFKQHCSACHTAGPYSGDPTGPQLDGVIGRKAASQPDYADYSSALLAWGMVWTPALMDQYLTAPKALVPGAKMTAVIPDPQDRADVVAFLASLK